RAAADARVGHHAGRGPAVHPAGLVGRHLPRPRHSRHRPVHQPDGRRPARCARPETEAELTAMHLRVPSIMLLLAASLVLAAPARATGVDAIIDILSDLGHGVVEESADDGPNLVVDDGAWAISL